MPGPAAQQAHEFHKPSDEELKHFLEHHISVLISDDGTATVSVIGECGKPKCPTHVTCCKYCKRPPC
jgi:hypothetical protein